MGGSQFRMKDANAMFFEFPKILFVDLGELSNKVIIVFKQKENRS